MVMLFFVAALLAFYFYRKAKNVSVYKELTSEQLFKRLWYLPCMQVVICIVVVGLAYMGVQGCMTGSQSHYVAPALEENFGFFGTIGAEILNQNMSSRMSPFIGKLDQLHGWALYLFYASIVALGIQIYALKERKLPCSIVLIGTLVISVISVWLAYQIMSTIDLATNTYLSAETFGLLKPDSAKAAGEGFAAAILFGAILLVLHFNHYNVIKRYYAEPVKNLNPMARFVNQPTQVSAEVTANESRGTEVRRNIPNTPAQPVDGKYIPCPVCGEMILKVAKKCKHCGEWIEQTPKEMIRCSVCGECVELTQGYCPVCHEPLHASHLPLDAEETTKECMICGEEILEFAKKCKHCGEWQTEKKHTPCPICSEDVEEENNPPVSPELKPESSEEAEAEDSKGRQMIPIVTIAVFVVAMVVFHLNYSYADWWIDEEHIVIPAIIVFAVLYYIVIYRIMGIKKLLPAYVSVAWRKYRKPFLIGLLVAAVLLGLAYCLSSSGNSDSYGAQAEDEDEIEVTVEENVEADTQDSGEDDYDDFVIN